MWYGKKLGNNGYLTPVVEVVEVVEDVEEGLQRMVWQEVREQGILATRGGGGGGAAAKSGMARS